MSMDEIPNGVEGGAEWVDPADQPASVENEEMKRMGVLIDKGVQSVEQFFSPLPSPGTGVAVALAYVAVDLPALLRVEAALKAIADMEPDRDSPVCCQMKKIAVSAFASRPSLDRK